MFPGGARLMNELDRSRAADPAASGVVGASESQLARPVTIIAPARAIEQRCVYLLACRREGSLPRVLDPGAIQRSNPLGPKDVARIVVDLPDHISGGVVFLDPIPVSVSHQNPAAGQCLRRATEDGCDGRCRGVAGRQVGGASRFIEDVPLGLGTVGLASVVEQLQLA